MRCRDLFILLVFCLSVGSKLAVAKPYKGAEIYSADSYLYGRYEIRMRAANASGVLSTFFTYKNGSEIGNTFWEEIDIEVFGKNDAIQWQSNIILGSSRPTLHTEGVHTADSSLADAYNTYVLEWTPEYVAWFLNGVEVRRITDTSTVANLTGPQSLRFNIWSSTSVPWVGIWDDSSLPVYYFVNYFEYQTYNIEAKIFEGGWRDDFNHFNSDRWAKANWTFDENRVDFDPENVVVKDGILVLALTHENALGFDGTPPVDELDYSSSSSSSSNSSESSSNSLSSHSELSSSSEPSLSSSVANSSSSTTSSQNRGSGGGGAITWMLLIMLSSLCAPRLFLKSIR